MRIALLLSLYFFKRLGLADLARLADKGAVRSNSERVRPCFSARSVSIFFSSGVTRISRLVDFIIAQPYTLMYIRRCIGF